MSFGLLSLPEAMREVLACQTVYRNIGFAEGEVFVTYSDEGSAMAMIIADGKTFAAEFPLPGHTNESFRELWSDAATMWNAAAQVERDALVDSSYVKQNLHELLAAIHAKGFELPRVSH
jgi:hypothetical protein